MSAVAPQREVEASAAFAAAAPGKLRALIFDVDGTMYDQALLRRLMLFRLARAYAARPLEGWRVARVLRAYRHAQELMRNRGEAGIDIAAEQIRLACESTRCDADFISRTVERWLQQEPLGLLDRCRWPGLVRLLQWARGEGIRLAVLSDYPAEAKLRALGIAEYFEVVLCAQSSEVGALKPHPAGLAKLAALMQIAPAEAVYVGDRDDVDRVCARRAGMHYVPADREAWQVKSGCLNLMRSLAAVALRLKKVEGVIP